MIESWAWHNGWPARRHQDYKFETSPHTTSLSKNKHKKYKITTKIDQFFEECSSIRNQVRKSLFSMLQYVAINMYYKFES